MKGRLDAYVTVSGWSVSATNGGGGPTVVTIPDGEYTPPALLVAFAAALNASRPSGWTVTGSFSEAGTGKVTINCSSTPWSIAWTSTGLRDYLGHAANITAVSSSQVGAYACEAVWLPACDFNLDGDHGVAGHIVSDRRSTISPSGVVHTLVSNRLRRHRRLVWSHVTRERAIDLTPSAAGLATMAWERWFLNTQLGGKAHYGPGAKVQFYTGDASPLGDFYLPSIAGIELPKSVDGWVGLWRVEIPELVAVS